MDTKRVAKVFCMRGNSILLLLSKHLNKWHLPGGHIQQGETFEDGLCREVKEETGCTLRYFHRVRMTSSSVALYVGRLNSGVIKLSEEHSNYMWVPLKQALSLPVCKFTFRDIRYLQTIMGAVKTASRVDPEEDSQ
jgi:8-oxo-dGTP pyrophosphatase MutT (NUDIX family)